MNVSPYIQRTPGAFEPDANFTIDAPSPGSFRLIALDCAWTDPRLSGKESVSVVSVNKNRS
jgi:hypothetical protein